MLQVLKAVEVMPLLYHQQAPIAAIQKNYQASEDFLQEKLFTVLLGIAHKRVPHISFSTMLYQDAKYLLAYQFLKLRRLRQNRVKHEGGAERAGLLFPRIS